MPPLNRSQISWDLSRTGSAARLRFRLASGPATLVEKVGVYVQSSWQTKGALEGMDDHAGRFR
jgi:hypothetical protein